MYKKKVITYFVFVPNNTVMLSTAIKSLGKVGLLFTVMG